MTEDTVNKAELARLVGVSERHIHTVLKHKTASRDLAERIARHNGGEPEHYLRPPRRRGRSRPYPFRDFVEETFGEMREAWQNGERKQDECTALVRCFNMMYRGLTEPMPSVDFLTLESLLNFAASAGNFRIEERDNIGRVWKLFRLWREEQLHMERIWDIENEEPGDFG